MRILSLYSSVNVHGNDAKGAFIPQAVRFKRVREAMGDTVESLPFDPTSKNVSADVLKMITNAQPFDAFIYFGHGTRRGLPSASMGYTSVGKLSAALASKAIGKRLVVVLYACSTANTPDAKAVDTGDGGFADQLRDALSVLGVRGWVDAHTVAGHTTVNRYTRRFDMDGKGPGIGGSWLVAPGSTLWKAWGDKLKSDEGFRFGFPFLDVAGVVARLAS